MNYFKLIILAILFTVFINMPTLTVSAEYFDDQNQVPIEAKNTAQKVLPHIKEILHSSAKDYSLNENKIDSDTTVSEGYKFYSLAISLPEDKNINFNDILRERRESYVFPIRISNKVIGMAFINYSKDKWKLSGLNGGDYLGESLSEAVRYSKGLLKKDEDILDTKLIYDEQIGLIALGVKTTTNEYIISLTDNSILNLEKNKPKIVTEIKDNIKNFYKSLKQSDKSDRRATGAYPSPSQDQNNSYIYIIAIAFIIAGLGIILWIRKKRQKGIREIQQ